MMMFKFHVQVKTERAVERLLADVNVHAPSPQPLATL